MTGPERANIIRESLVRLHAVEVSVVSLTCDGPSQNLAIIRELGANLDIMDMRPYFLHPEDHTQKVHVLLDPCHMLKLLRNVFLTVEVLVREDGQQIRWRYIEELHKLQEKDGLRLGNKLKMAHILWCNQKMKVNLAPQLFSSSECGRFSRVFVLYVCPVLYVPTPGLRLVVVSGLLTKTGHTEYIYQYFKTVSSFSQEMIAVPILQM
ncbi:hypothetical protein QQF64_033940 [Cirrhinus molitorella]|uniref:THAP domain containing 9 n=1 Tax=Cirrhinus molitorella TaxID=172907 RepID=A0ABR3MVB9_9TELE